MNTSFQVMALLGCCQALFLATVLVGARKTRQPADRLLVLLLTAFALIVGGTMLNVTGQVLDFPHLAQLHTPLRLALGPLLYLYCQWLVNPKRSLHVRDGLHFLPLAADVIWLMPFYLLDGTAKRAFMAEALQNFPVEWKVRTAAVLIQFGIYLVLACQLRGQILFRPVSANRKPWTNWHKPGDGWLLTLAGIWVIGVLRLVFAFKLQTGLLVPACFSVCIYWAGFVWFKQILIDGRALMPVLPTQIESVPPLVERKYLTSSLTPDRGERLAEQLQKLVVTQKPYLQPELTLRDVAASLSATPQQVSQLINERFDQNFSDWVNRHRVEEAKRRLADPRHKHLSILAIAEDSGFNSKSTFNAAFKKHTGVTPSQFRESAVESAVLGPPK
ncbi:MAG: helix-turn-helix domain-containing protein [Blastocatellia bacterium]|nr:helix-turn-helix domain-containing protein [Blastocatellia bacterium]